MKHLGLMVGLFMLVRGLVHAAAEPAASAPLTSSATPIPGLAAAEAITTITGVAISPLLGVSAVGAWKYFKTPPEKRANLPWFAQPWFWAPALAIVILCFVKDTLGTTWPTAVKKPFDVLDAFENKISALIAAGAFVPLIATFLATAEEANSSALWTIGPFVAAIDPAPFLNALLIPFGLAAFFAVWMAAYAINILILLSPFTTVDLALKAFRTLLLAFLAGLALYDVVLGALFSMLLIAVSFLIAGWSFRLMIFGNVFAWDFITNRRQRFQPANEGHRAFLATRLEHTPIRTLGRLTKNERGQMQFEYRPWLALPKRALQLPTGDYAVGRGLLHPALVRIEGNQEREILWLPPRFAGHEEVLAQIYNLRGVHDVGLLRGFKAVWRWLKQLCGLGRIPIETAATAA